MKAAVVRAAGEMPAYEDFADPEPAAGEVRIEVMAAAVSQVVKSRASGRHYSSSSAFPFLAGIDGVGRREDGKRVFFFLPRAPYGSMAERAVVPAAHCVALPNGLDDVTAAAIANPGMSSWAAYTNRAKLTSGETVLVNGATGTAGRLAVQIARHFAAAKVIATGRNADALADVGADVTIVLGADGDTLENHLKVQFAAGVDVVIDYLWGQSAERILIAAAKAAPEAVPVRYVEVGSVSGGDITLPSAVLRSSGIVLMGSGLGSIPPEGLAGAIADLMRAAGPGGFRIETKSMPLADVTAAWGYEGRERVVLTTR